MIYLNFLILAMLASVSVLQGSDHLQCFPVHSDKIESADLALANPAFAPLPPHLEVSYSPVPGVERNLSVAEVERFAKKNGISARIASPICFSWPLHTISKNQIEEAIHRSLSSTSVDLEIADQSRFQVPDGELTLPLAGLTGSSDKPVIWNGFVTYAGSRRIDTWVRVKIIVHEEHIIALRQIRTGECVDALAVKTVAYDGPLTSTDVIKRIADANGTCAKWDLAPGTKLLKSMLSAPNDVKKQQLVTVRIINGATHIETQGIATDAGQKGSVIRVRNPKTGRTFRARIDDPGVVTVIPGGSFGLVTEDGKS